MVNELIDSPATYSVLVQNTSGDTVFAFNPDKLMIPASTQKLITAAIAYKYLGSDYRIPTFIGYDGFTHNNILFGNLVITGTGDPSLDSRYWQSPEIIFQAWADSLKSHGIREIRGDIIGNDDQFEEKRLGSGWAWDDLSFSYASEFGPLMAENSLVRFSVSAMPEDDSKISIIEKLPLDYMQYREEITFIDTLPEHIHARRSNGTDTIRIYGNYGSKKQVYDKTITVPNPTLYYVSLLKRVLANSGIVISGNPVDIDDAEEKPQEITPIFTHYSPELIRILRQFLYHSNNQAGEVLFRHTAWHETGKGSFANGRIILEAFLEYLKVYNNDYRLADACGLSRYNLVSAELLNKILLYLQNESDFVECLPQANCTGTLSKRTLLAGIDLKAKTGSMSRIECISGYLTTRKGDNYVITVMINNFPPDKNNRHPVDQFIKLFYEL